MADLPTSIVAEPSVSKVAIGSPKSRREGVLCTIYHVHVIVLDIVGERNNVIGETKCEGGGEPTLNMSGTTNLLFCRFPFFFVGF